MTIVFLGETRGVPYHKQIRQFNKAYMYGKPENCSVVLFLITRRNVSLHIEQQNGEYMALNSMNSARNCSGIDGCDLQG